MRKSKKQPLRQPPIQRGPQHPDVFTHASAWSRELTPEGVGPGDNDEKVISRKAILGVMGISLLIFLALVTQLIQLQVVRGERLRGVAEGNRIRKQITYAPRGRILSRDGTVLASNTASFQLSATPYRLPDSSSKRQDMYQRVAGVLKDESPQTISQSVKEKGLDHPRPVLISERIPRRTALKLEYMLPQLHGFGLSSIPTREYKTGAGLAHIVGYTGRVSERDISQHPDILPNGFIGKTGIEASYDDTLRGQNGVVKTEVDARGKPVRTLREQSTKAGEDVRLTIDYGLQKQFAQAIKRQMRKADVSRASGVIMDPATGAVRAMVSFPQFNHNLFADGISRQQFQRLKTDPAQPMLNRAIAAGYPSGSVIKPIVLLGALDTDTVNEDTIIHDRGSITVRSQYDPSVTFTYEGWNPSGLGPMNARRAIAMSSNIYFYTVAGGNNTFDGMGIDNLVNYLQMFGLGEATNVDLPNETRGRVPTPEWKRAQHGEVWHTGDTYNLAIGQGSLLVSPLQMLRAHSAIANGGNLMRPFLAQKAGPKVAAKPDITARDYRVVREGMRMVTSGSGTTPPSTFADVGASVAGKSGTAETNPGVRDSHAWYSAFAPSQDPQLQGVVILEDGEGGSKYAAPALADAFAWYFQGHDSHE
jgi:penicillin-binding protein 2